MLSVLKTAAAIGAYASAGALAVDADLLGDSAAVGKLVPRRPAAWVYVGQTGDLTLTTVTGSSATFKSVPAGQVLYVDAVTITAATTTAQKLVVGWP